MTEEKRFKLGYYRKHRVQLSRGARLGTSTEKKRVGLHASCASRQSHVGLSHESMKRGLQETEKPYMQGGTYRQKHASPSGWTEISFSERKVTGLKWCKMVFIQMSPIDLARGTTF